MLKYKLLVFLLFSLSYSWAQLHPTTHQHLLEVLQYEESLENNYPIYLGISEGIEEAAPLHYYQASENGVSRLSTYYYTKQDSLVTSAIHQWGNFDAMFQSKLPYTKKTIKVLRDNYTSMQEELAKVYGDNYKVYEDSSPNTIIRSKVVKWLTPILYDPTLDHREMYQDGKYFGITALSYANLSWEDSFLNQLSFLQYYFTSNIKAGKYRLSEFLLSPELKDVIKEEHFDEISEMLNNHRLELYNSREGFAGIEREYLFMYKLIDAKGVTKFNMNIAFNNKQDISFLQYRPIK